tara:strand:- start:85 stop:618 length:534 start_codon:yes stop_codon:yes gene_type:complete
MGQEFFINSQDLENKIRQLLPSQGGAGAGFDLSASTQIIPIIDLTESAEGSNLRGDIQSSLSLNSVTNIDISNGTSTIINTTGYFRIFGNIYISSRNSPSTGSSATLQLTDGSTTKVIYKVLENSLDNLALNQNVHLDFLVLLEAGQSLTGTTSDSQSTMTITTRQIASLDKTLTNP